MPDTIKVRLTVTLEVDVVAWAREFGTDTSVGEVRDDVRSYFAPPNIIPAHLADIVRSTP